MTLPNERCDNPRRENSPGLSAAAILACGALGFAGPAHADQVMQGVYNYMPQDAPADTWTIYPSCVPVVGDLRVALGLPVACRLHVRGRRSTGVDARPGRRDVAVQHDWRDGMTCPDGSTAPTTETVRFDDVTMTGTRNDLPQRRLRSAAGQDRPSVHVVLQGAAADPRPAVPALLRAGRPAALLLTPAVVIRRSGDSSS